MCPQPSTWPTSIAALVATVTAKTSYALRLPLLPKMRGFTIRSDWHSCGKSSPLRRSNELRKAAELDPGQARYTYVYAVALHSAGRGNEAIAALKENLVRHPNDRDTLLALINFSRESGDISSALEYAERLELIAPNAPGLTGLIQDLRRQAAKPIAQ